MRHRDDFANAGALCDLHRDRVDRLCQPFRQGHLALIAACIVARLPIPDADRRVDELV